MAEVALGPKPGTVKVDTKKGQVSSPNLQRNAEAGSRATGISNNQGDFLRGINVLAGGVSNAGRDLGLWK